MKRKSIYITCLGALLTFSGCKKILEVQPENQLDAAIALSDINGYQALLMSVYDRLQSYTYYGRDMALMGDALADNIFTHTANASGRYVGQNANTRSSHYNVWTNVYSGINELNTIIATIDKFTTLSGTQATLQKQIKAEAYALRGMMYFDLARIYGYEPGKVPTTGSNANFDKSAVIRLKPTAGVGDAVSIPRSNITDTYTAIEADMNAAIAGFKAIGTSKPANPYRFSESAAHAIFGKILLYESKWAQAVTEFDNALNANITPSTLAPIAAGGYSAAFKRIPNPESLLELYYNQSVEVTGVTGSNDGLFTYTTPATAALSTFGGQTVSDELYSLFSAGDDRLAMFYTSASTRSAVVMRWTNKYSAAGGPYTDDVWIIRYSDIILMKAEALANQGQYATAAGLVVQLRASRNAGTTITVPTDASLLSFIQDERRRELFFEGHRWFDLKRTGSNITKPLATAVGTIAYTDYRLLAPLPVAEATFNPALPQNPNY
ncbi:RagB/SusD family nutrient uptake outer membrane protein [Mucilaginibacter terrae]|uniref:Zn-binding protein involved in type VI secretion n=1 Tax=Mucilaginibacter terrae TaxID=1955052 RepID=A0ABU3GZM8_9SPHI|nr:RagB/SusD family nutrient uptake outer membrane protein [Mucilaginibacter terrae]MDT3405225.1 putative Zn-binding protein involved in type VI secretion [Mucilaginibacter terrae]